MFDIYYFFGDPWPSIKAKLDVLRTFVEAQNGRLSMAVIPDATVETYAAAGGAANRVLNDLFLQYCFAEPHCVGLFPFLEGHWDAITHEPGVFQGLNAIADAVKSQSWLGTAAEPGVKCADPDATLLHLPDCAEDSGTCNAAMSLVTGNRTQSNATVLDILPARPISMVLGQIWRYKGVCRELVNSWSPGSKVCCSGLSTGCWQNLIECSSKSKIVPCGVVDFVEQCDIPGWTCCAPKKSMKHDDAVGEAPDLRCINASSSSLTVAWARVDATDLYYVAVASSPTARPAVLQTTLDTSLVLTDLWPSREYYLTLRSHPSTEPVPEVWGWRPAGRAVRCRTASESRAAPHRLRRSGDTPHPSELRLEWRPREGSDATTHSVGIRRMDAAADAWRWVKAPAPSSATLRSLDSASSFEVVVRDEATGSLSETLVMRTSSIGARHSVAWRASECKCHSLIALTSLNKQLPPDTFDVDFLQNHDAADSRTLPLYLQYSGAINESCYSGFAPGAAHCNSHGGLCIDKLSTLCAEERGNGFECMRCADRYRAQLLDTCGNFVRRRCFLSRFDHANQKRITTQSDADDIQDSGRWGEHWFCGTGWPGSTFQRSPFTEYCVEHAMAPQTDPTP